MSTHPLIQLARQSIAHGLEHGRALPVRVEDHPAEWQVERACFVTLNKHGNLTDLSGTNRGSPQASPQGGRPGKGVLRGCIGNLQAIQPLVRDVAENAWNAAFRDPRFPPVIHAELELLEIHISILGVPEIMTVRSETELLETLRPGEDGLIIEALGRRATFLPSVWAQLPAPEDFFMHLKHKAGLPMHGWPEGMRVWRYGVEEIG